MELLPADPNQAFRISEDDLPAVNPSEASTQVDGAGDGPGVDGAGDGVDENQPRLILLLPALKVPTNGEQPGNETSRSGRKEG